MLKDVLGQPGAVSLLGNFLTEEADGRTVLILGEKGTGKFTAATAFAEEALGKNPFLTPDFNFYRNDDFSMKTRFYLENRKNPAVLARIPGYLHVVLGRLALAVSLGETGKTSVKFKKLSKGGDSSNVLDFRSELENILLNGTLDEWLENPAFISNLEAVSDEISKKKKVPIDFVRRTIEFHSMRSPSGKRITVIGGFDTATEEAQNSGLKLFEEPAPGSMILLTAEDTNGILPTILSRCIVLKFNPLARTHLETIFGGKTGERFRTTVGHMEDSVYHYSDTAKKKVREFFTDIAPKIQKDNRVFRFVDEITSDENNQLPVLFLDEIVAFLRSVFISRQSRLRGTDLDAFTDRDYAELTSRLADGTNTSEIRELSESVGETANGIRYRNITDGSVLPNLLIDLARWYQKRARSS